MSRKFAGVLVVIAVLSAGLNSAEAKRYRGGCCQPVQRTCCQPVVHTGCHQPAACPTTGCPTAGGCAPVAACQPVATCCAPRVSQCAPVAASCCAPHSAGYGGGATYADQGQAPAAEDAPPAPPQDPKAAPKPAKQK